MPESKTFTDPDGKTVQINIGGTRVRKAPRTSSPFDQKGQRVGTDSPFLQTGQKVEHSENFISRDGKTIPLSQATPEEKEQFYNKFPSLRPID